MPYAICNMQLPVPVPIPVPIPAPVLVFETWAGSISEDLADMIQSRRDLMQSLAWDNHNLHIAPMPS
ncbi:hypothetical protein BHYA_0658g00020 [Botrytis hyacinthi]|uniref:Uncharacterized protein n=1 Tax=Botrytis hyacinthi TaxID=278943 RepID=A0A4Z1G361_9HELO|nr:hypothetical protein BHYA_0658g00020 [Botrytis hyacinthi]